MEYLSAIYCGHANEVPLVCKCPLNCYCKQPGYSCAMAKWDTDLPDTKIGQIRVSMLASTFRRLDKEIESIAKNQAKKLTDIIMKGLKNLDDFIAIAAVKLMDAIPNELDFIILRRISSEGGMTDLWSLSIAARKTNRIVFYKDIKNMEEFNIAVDEAIKFMKNYNSAGAK